MTFHHRHHYFNSIKFNLLHETIICTYIEWLQAMKRLLIVTILVCFLQKSHADYYTTLGVKRDATTKEIRSAFKKLALSSHPDKNKVILPRSDFNVLCTGCYKTFVRILNYSQNLTIGTYSCIFQIQHWLNTSDCKDFICTQKLTNYALKPSR